jgi:serine protease
MKAMRDPLRVLCAIAAAIVVAGIAGRGEVRQESSSGALDEIDRGARPTAIDRGLVRGEARSPDSVERQHARGLQLPSAARFRTGTTGAPYLRGRVIVRFKDGTSSVSTAASMSAVRALSRSAALSARPSSANFDVVAIGSSEDAEEIAAALRERPDVEYAQPAYRVQTEMVPNDQYYKRQWNLPMIDLERAWDIQPQAGSSVTVAVIDTGLAYTNTIQRYTAPAFTDDQGIKYPALGPVDVPFVAATDLINSGRIVSPYDFIWDTSTPLDLDGHGTHVSGTIGQLTNNSAGTAGVAFNVKLMPIKVIDTDWDDIFGSPNQGTDDMVARGIRWAADHGAKVINMSIGRTGPSAPVIEDAMKYAIGKGSFIAVAAGNDYENGNPTEVLAEIASRLKGAVSVAAVDQAKAHAYYSSSGSWVELAAPGGSFRGFGSQGEGGILQQTYDLALVDTFDLSPKQYGAPRFDALAYYYFVGTSQATPHVSGLAALMVQQGFKDPASIESALEATATDLGDHGRDDLFGFGLIDARSVLRGLGLAK